MHDLCQAFYESSNAFGGCVFPEGAIGDAQQALVFHAESHAGDDGYFVFFDQLLDKSHRIHFYVHSQQKIERSIGTRHCDQIGDAGQLIQAYPADRSEWCPVFS